MGISVPDSQTQKCRIIGYVIPAPVIKHFITDYERSRDYTGFPILGIEWQKMENPDLRLAMGMKSNQKGVRTWGSYWFSFLVSQSILKKRLKWISSWFKVFQI